jgi:cytoskeletal protein RodZ
MFSKKYFTPKQIEHKREEKKNHKKKKKKKNENLKTSGFFSPFFFLIFRISFLLKKFWVAILFNLLN